MIVTTATEGVWVAVVIVSEELSGGVVDDGAAAEDGVLCWGVELVSDEGVDDGVGVFEDWSEVCEGVGVDEGVLLT